MSTQDVESGRREGLGFPEAVIRHIEPAIARFGFCRGGTTSYVVEFESPGVSLVVTHDRLSYDIGVEVWRNEAPSEACTLGQILAAEGVPPEKSSFQASTPERVDAMTMAIADTLRTHASRALAGDPGTFQRVRAAATTRAEAYTKVVVQHPIRLAAEDAWRRRDYATVRNLYASLAPDLTAVERQRMEYARSHPG